MASGGLKDGSPPGGGPFYLDIDLPLWDRRACLARTKPGELSPLRGRSRAVSRAAGGWSRSNDLWNSPTGGLSRRTAATAGLRSVATAVGFMWVGHLHPFTSSEGVKEPSFMQRSVCWIQFDLVTPPAPRQREVPPPGVPRQKPLFVSFVTTKKRQWKVVIGEKC